MDSEKGVDVRRELAYAVVARGWGLLELRPMRMSLEDIFLSVTTEETGGQPPSPVRGGGLMRNILAMAGKELRGYFASPIAYVLIGFYALLFGWFFYTLLSFFERQSMQMSPGGPGGALNINQMLISPLLMNASVIMLLRVADDHDAHLLGREALRARSSCC